MKFIIIILTAICCLFGFYAQAQTTLYSEDFSGESLGGITFTAGGDFYQIDNGSSSCTDEYWKIDNLSATGTACTGCFWK